MDGIERAPGLPPAPTDLCDEVAAALGREHDRTHRWRALRCQGARRVRGSIWRLEVADLSSVTWSWEGGTALAPRDLSMAGAGGGGGEPEAALWRGVVVEADEVQGLLYVDVLPGGGEDAMPGPGSFLVRPHAYLASLHRLFTDPLFASLRPDLASALAAAAGQAAGAVVEPEGLARLVRATERTWGILWGPPGTGKTWTIGRQVAALWPAPRILVVSTTNKATDGVALSVARALRDRLPGEALEPRLVRVGSGADVERFAAEGLTKVLAGGEVGLRRRLLALQRQRLQATDSATRAALTAELQRTRRQVDGCSRAAFLAEECRVVVTTAFNALRLLTDPDLLGLLEAGRAPFDLVVVDEAGLISRAATAALSLLAARRVLLVGDPRQLAPIAEMNRLLPPGQAGWLGESGLAHLDSAEQTPPGVCLLRVQHRMHPDIRAAISAYQYDGRLADGAGVPQGELPGGMPRAGWLVLDAFVADPLALRADRGPGGRSRVRRCTPDVLEAILSASPELAGGSVMFITPFAGQARLVRAWAEARGLAGWVASTVHRQQGAEADFVLLDTVHAGLAAWPPEEWQRLLNVGLSRAREGVLLLASREELEVPWVRPLQDLLSPCTLRPGYGGGLHWQLLPPIAAVALPIGRSAVGSMGARIAELQQARPVLSADQRRLCEAALDGGPRLVRGVAGSGKTLVLAHWVARTLAESPRTRPLWVVYGNSALQRPLADQILDAWQQRCPGQPLPWRRLALWHIRDLLRALLPEAGLALDPRDFDYDPACRAWMEHAPRPAPRCAVLFLDEAQDFGPQTLRLLFSLVAVPDPAQPGRRPVMVFYDHDQNLYGRPLPRWAALGLDVRGRAAILREAYRSTRPLTTLALNVLYRLRPPRADAEHRQLLRRGLVTPTIRRGRRWWRPDLTEIEGPLPGLLTFPDREAEVEAITRQVLCWTRQEGVAAGDIRILSHAPELRIAITDALRAAGVATAHQAGQALPTDPHTLLVTTPHSYKGHEAEVILVAGLDRFATRRGPLACALYVAMTRARSVLVLTGLEQPDTPGGQAVLDAVAHAVAVLAAPPSPLEALADADAAAGGPGRPPQAELLRQVGEAHLGWLATLWARHRIRLEPLALPAVASPLFWLQREADGACFACYGHEEPDEATRDRLQAAGVHLLRLGQPLDAA